MDDLEKQRYEATGESLADRQRAELLQQNVDVLWRKLGEQIKAQTTAYEARFQKAQTISITETPGYIHVRKFDNPMADLHLTKNQSCVHYEFSFRVTVFEPDTPITGFIKPALDKNGGLRN